MIFDPIVIVKGSNSYNMPLIVETKPGAQVIAALGSTILRSTANLDGIATLLLPAPGEYDVYAVVEGVNSNIKQIEAPSNMSLKFGESRLPTEYVELEYIDNASDVSAQKAYISAAGIHTHSSYNTIINFDVELVETVSGSGSYSPSFIGSYINYGSSSSQNNTILAIYMYGSNRLLRFQYGSGLKNTTGYTYNTSINMLDNRRVIGKWDMANAMIEINGAYYSTGSSIYQPDSTMATVAVGVFPRQGTSMTVSATTVLDIMHLRKFQVYYGDQLAFDYIPAKRISDGVCGLYELVSEQFYTSASGYPKPVGGPEV